MHGYVRIYDNRQGYEYRSYNTESEVTLQANEYLSIFRRVQNPAKDLR